MNLTIHNGKPPAREPKKWASVYERVSQMYVGDSFGLGAPEGITIGHLRRVVKGASYKFKFVVNTQKERHILWVTRVK